MLEHHYPRNKSEPSSVTVDINAVVDDLNSELVRVGAWLNVMGYIRESDTPTSSFASSQMDLQLEGYQSSPTVMPTKVSPRPVLIEAVMVFSAGAIAVGDYERILRQSQDIEPRVRG